VTSDLVSGTAAATGAQHADPVAFFEQVHRAFVLAEQVAGGPTDRFYAIGGFTIHLRFAGPAMVPSITPAFEHLAAAPSSPAALTVCLWDGASTGVTMPPPPWENDDFIARGEVRGYTNERIKTAFHLGPCVLSMLDNGSNRAIMWVRDARHIPYAERAAPLRIVLHWWMREHGRQLIHAAAVGKPGGGVLVAGKSGSGKSTVALACLTSELLYLSDDLILLRREPIPYAYSIYNSAKLEIDHGRGLPHLRSAIEGLGEQGTEKAIVFLHEHYPQHLGSAFPIRAVLLPRVTGLGETRLIPTSPAASLMALAPSTLFQLSGAGPDDFREIAEFVRQVPCYALEVGTDLRQVPRVVLDLLSETGAC
jgi:hypothetical protein